MAKVINSYTVNKTLKSMPNISKEERGYLNSVLKKDLINGLDSAEVKQKIKKLQFNKGDTIDKWELRGVKERLLKRLGE